jgi:citrate lyase subunit beta/citryl-CoA lyase
MSARSLLYVPADRPEFLEKALGRGADGVVVDLEDAVAHERKAGARADAAAWLASIEPGDTEVWVRVNADDHLEADVLAMRDLPVAGLVVAKAEPDTVAAVAALAPDLALLALVESAVGLLFAPEIAAHESVTRLMVGEADLGAELAIDPTDDEMWAPHRARVVMASAAAGLPGPVGPVSTDFRDLDALASGTELLRRQGFGGRSCIHPSQLEVVNATFTPTDEEVAEAEDVLSRYESALGTGTGVVLDAHGRMVDEAVVRIARETVAKGRR